ncbi:Pimeloyl-ACP methyl ester carboxylesterase [Luteibacter sp. UNC138MFCol5.1]|uniref:alpha/beta fold hydrolase n=1 Tax=Luteibacter sp. UNC138MFCol5.1 TaxID=1502774 RepID=UPI0008C91262|nr:alpha/beta hydrolase [Luteibacter sp. UNC138MFCol5.1]SEO43723.1 Pimeloyl-ACP methyl ester carboxylesterase [Luteibacter sp. UNC138MFCol5.1]
MRELKVAIPGLELAGLSWGEPDAAPLILLHGWLDNAASFALLAPRLADRFHVIALDLPGHGHSAHLPEGTVYQHVDYARAVLAAADALALPRFHLLGHSLGAGVATMVAIAAPERIRALALIEGLGPLGDDGSRTLDRFREAMASKAEGNRPLRVFASIEDAARARALASGLDASLATHIVARGLREVGGGYSWRSDPRLSRPTAIRLAETQVMALLLGLAAPTSLLLARPHPPYLEPEALQIRIDCVDDIRVTHMDGGHHLHLEHPEAVANWLHAAL